MLYRIYIPPFLVLPSVNQSSDKERKRGTAATAAHTPGGKKKKKRFQPSYPPPSPPLTATLIPPFKTHSCLCLRGAAEMKGNMQCTAFDCELCSVIRGKFTGLVCILNTCRRSSSQLWERLKRQWFQSGVW